MNAFHSTPFRLAVILIAVFSSFTLAGFAGAYLVTRANLIGDIDARIAATVDALQTAVEEDEVAERAGEIAASADSRDLMLRYDVPGKPSVGTLATNVEAKSGGVIEGATLGLPNDRVSQSYTAWSGMVGTGFLTVLASRDRLLKLRETFLTVLLLCLVPALIVATGVGAFVARRARDRLEEIRLTLVQITSGHVDARVPMKGQTQDDLGMIALAVNQMAEAQSASNRALRQVSDDIAHDLRTPIQHVALLLEQLEGQAVTETGRAIVDAARAETNQIIETFRTLLQIAQMEGGQARLGFQPVDLTSVVASVVELYMSTAEDTGHSLTAHILGPATVRGDRTLLGRMVANLIQNAIRHTAGGRIDLTLTGEPSPVLTVRDEGPGIPVSERGNVLRRLYRLERSRTTEGSGLGLSLVAAIAELHHARLELGDASPGLAVTISF